MKVRCKVRIHGVGAQVHEIGEVVDDMPDDVAREHIKRGNAELASEGEQSTPVTRTAPAPLRTERSGKGNRSEKPADPTTKPPPVDPPTPDPKTETKPSETDPTKEPPPAA